MSRPTTGLTEGMTMDTKSTGASDLASRLRERVQLVAHEELPQTAELMASAADRIEALEGAVDEAVSHLDHLTHGNAEHDPDALAAAAPLRRVQAARQRFERPADNANRPMIGPKRRDDVMGLPSEMMADEPLPGETSSFIDRWPEKTDEPRTVRLGWWRRRLYLAAKRRATR